MYSINRGKRDQVSDAAGVSACELEGNTGEMYEGNSRDMTRGSSENDLEQREPACARESVYKGRMIGKNVTGKAHPGAT